MKSTQIESLVNQINNLMTEQLIELNNIYCQSCSIDSEIYSNDEEFFAMFYPNTGDGLKVAQAIFYGDYNYSHDYVRFNGYGNLESINYFEAKDLCEFPETIAEYALENESEFDHILDFDFEEIED